MLAGGSIGFIDVTLYDNGDIESPRYRNDRFPFWAFSHGFGFPSPEALGQCNAGVSKKLAGGAGAQT